MTTGEVARALERIERGTEAINDKLDRRPTWEDIKRLETARDNQLTEIKAGPIAEIKADVSKLEHAQTWLMRTTIGAVIVAVIGILIRIPEAL